MKFTRDTSQALSITAVDDGEIRLGEKIYRKTIAVTSSEVIENWPEKPVAELTPQDFSALLDHGPELIVLGTGARNVFAPRQVTFALARKGIGLEVMSTGAAARTFNVLAGEGRRVAALLYVQGGPANAREDRD